MSQRCHQLRHTIHKQCGFRFYDHKRICLSPATTIHFINYGKYVFKQKSCAVATSTKALALIFVYILLYYFDGNATTIAVAAIIVDVVMATAAAVVVAAAKAS